MARLYGTAWNLSMGFIRSSIDSSLDSFIGSITSSCVGDLVGSFINSCIWGIVYGYIDSFSPALSAAPSTAASRRAYLIWHGVHPSIRISIKSKRFHILEIPNNFLGILLKQYSYSISASLFTHYERIITFRPALLLLALLLSSVICFTC